MGIKVSLLVWQAEKNVPLVLVSIFSLISQPLFVTEETFSLYLYFYYATGRMKPHEARMGCGHIFFATWESLKVSFGERYFEWGFVINMSERKISIHNRCLIRPENCDQWHNGVIDSKYRDFCCYTWSYNALCFYYADYGPTLFNSIKHLKKTVYCWLII